MLGGNPTHWSYAQLPYPDSQRVLWECSTNGGVLAQPLVLDSIVYYLSAKGELRTVRIGNGIEIGSMNLPGQCIGAPVIETFYLYAAFSSGDQTFIATDLESGKTLWKHNLGPIEASVVSQNDHLFVVNLKGEAFCVNRTDGVIVWKFTSGIDKKTKISRSTPAVDNRVVAFGADDGALFVLDRQKGALLWSKNCTSPIMTAPVIVDSTVVVASLNGMIYAFGITSGTLRWKFDCRARLFGAPATDGQRVYIGTGKGTLFALNVDDGSPLWTYQTSGMINSAPLVAEQRVIVGTLDKHLFVFDSNTGTLINKFETAGRVRLTPILWGDILVVTTDDKQITAYGPIVP
jgi:outer membrane protein assembly factor BamB